MAGAIIQEGQGLLEHSASDRSHTAQGRAIVRQSAPTPLHHMQAVDLRPLKAATESLDPAHPLRVLLMGEPDEVSAGEYVAKVRGWFRLMKVKGP